jgi:hypothetical protein
VVVADGMVEEVPDVDAGVVVVVTAVVVGGEVACFDGGAVVPDVAGGEPEQ